MMFRLALSPLFFSLWLLSVCHAVRGAEHFSNPLREGADPWVIRDEDGKRWLWCSAPGAERIVIRATPTLTDPGKEREIWKPSGPGPAAAQVWAPELHFLDGRWFVYFAASDGRNETHRAFVLSADSKDPMGSWTLNGPLATGDGEDRNRPQVWAIDMTVLSHKGIRYAVWSGWDTPDSDRQFLYLARMSTPLTLTGPRVRICRNDDYPWERTDETSAGRGLNEGPQVLQHAGRTFLIYSCGGAWLPSYKLGLLELTGPDPLKPLSWHKHDKPVFQGTGKTFGVGHSCFVNSRPGAWWHIYHAKQDRAPGWARSIFLQPFHFDALGLPDFGQPLPFGGKLAVPDEGH